MLSLRVALALLLLPISIGAQTTTRTPQVISYGAESTSFGELLVPTGVGPFPVVVLVHGGCWIASLGSTESMRPLAEKLSERGVATWNVEYRRVGHPGGGWPGSFRDLSDAVDHLKALAADGQPLDIDRVVAVGHSSGGYFAAWLAARSRLPSGSPLVGPEQVPVGGVVSTDAFLDPLVVDSKGVDGRIYCREPILERLVGGHPDTVPEQVRQASPIELLPWGVPQEYVVSSRRYPVTPPRPLADGRTTMVLSDYPALARAAGDQIQVRIITDAEHMGTFTEPTTEAGMATEAAIVRLIDMLP